MQNVLVHRIGKIRVQRRRTRTKFEGSKKLRAIFILIFAGPRRKHERSSEMVSLRLAEQTKWKQKEQQFKLHRQGVDF